MSSFFPDELYQGYITGLPGGRWFTLQLPFRDMTLTRLGRLSYIQRDLDGGFTLESIGEPASLWVGLDVCVRSICRGGVTNAHLTSPTQSQTPAWPHPGFLIADGQSGPFRLEVGAVSAISKITGRAPDDRARAGGEEEDGAEETEEEDGGGGGGCCRGEEEAGGRSGRGLRIVVWG